MIARRISRRPAEWHVTKNELSRPWLLPLRRIEWIFEWIAYGLSRWSFLEVLEYLGSLSILVGIIFYFSESGDRIKLRHYQAWQVINTAQGKGGSGGRIEALQELNADKVPLVGVNVSSAFLQGVHLERANLLRADMSAADLRGSALLHADLTFANLQSANFRGSDLRDANLADANLSDSDLVGSNLSGAQLDNANLSSADLRNANLQNIAWQRIAAFKSANIAGVMNAPAGFRDWALKNGALEKADGDN
ncbi:pentapeptide repeat-containing protein [Occallatibacter savannae]|uniref:pentapeptide repeat-containing protein n=1 Tax=Occallatibacter savannae TaxID=1002691 RepID=UPI000D6980CA|nr:pentapeptide repeat-containing protein [Occallatibacter savannae]